MNFKSSHPISMQPQYVPIRSNPTNNLPAAANRKGFTLLELLVGIVIFATVLLATNMVFHNALSLREKAQRRLDAGIPENYASRFFRRDIQGMIFTAGLMASTLTSESSGGSQSRSDRLEFYTTSGRPSQGGNQSDVQKVEYYLDNASLANNANASSSFGNNSGASQMTGMAGRTLYRRVTGNALAVSDSQLDYQPLLEDVEAFQVQLCDGETWLDSWDSTVLTTNLPTAVRLRVVYADSLSVNGSSPSSRARKPVEWVIPALTEFKQDLNEEEEEDTEI
jgi:prepilin-type N-terminal cleavage/methylation domain-containing protein